MSNDIYGTYTISPMEANVKTIWHDLKPDPLCKALSIWCDSMNEKYKFQLIDYSTDEKTEFRHDANDNANGIAAFRKSVEDEIKREIASGKRFVWINYEYNPDLYNFDDGYPKRVITLTLYTRPVEHK